MPSTPLSPEKLAQAQVLANAIREATVAEIDELARTLVATDDSHPFGATEFKVRDLAHQIAAKAIDVSAVPKVTERVHAALLEELTLEDRINDEVRVILEAYSEEMNKTGANYQEMFRKVKSELVRKYKAVL